MNSTVHSADSPWMKCIGKRTTAWMARLETRKMVH